MVESGRNILSIEELAKLIKTSWISSQNGQKKKNNLSKNDKIEASKIQFYQWDEQATRYFITNMA